ncbi:MAG: GcrA cell cycle regulator [Caulobacter sp.]|nr:GcrA cell cycle regulator [Caulobacter sp.]
MEWTESRISTLTTLWQAGQSASQVARQLGGISRSAVIGKVHRLRLSGRALPARPRAVAAPRPSRAVRAPSQAKERANRLSTVERSSHVVTLRGYLPAAATPRNELAATATIMTLGPASCRWPIGDPRDGDFGYCGRPRPPMTTYCDCHAQAAFYTRKGRGPDLSERGRVAAPARGFDGDRA